MLPFSYRSSVHRRLTATVVPLWLTVLTGLAAPAAQAQYATTVLADKPVAYYRMDEAGGTMVVNYAPSGAVNNGVLHIGKGKPTIFKQNGALPGETASTSYQLGGDYISVPRTISDDFTIEFLFRTTSPGPGNGLGQFYDGMGLVNADMPFSMDDFGTAISGGRVLFGVGKATADHDLTIRSKAGLNDGKWHMVDAVRSRSTGTIQLYIDGVLSVSATGGTQALNSANEIEIGKIPSDYVSAADETERLNGGIDEVALYPTALDADAVRRHYAAAMNPSPSPAPASAGDVVTLGLFRKLTGHSEYVNSVAFSPDSLTLASGSRDKTVRLWDVQTGIQKEIVGKHDGYVSCVAFSPDGHTVISGGWDNKVRQFDITGGDEISEGKFNKNASYVLSLAFSPNGRRLADGSNDKTARNFSVATGAFDGVATLPDAVASVGFSPDGSHIVGACLDGSVYVWDALTMKELHHLTVGAATAIAAPQFAAVFLDEDTVAAGGKDGVVRVWTLHNDTIIARLAAGGKEVYSLAYDSHHHLLAGGGGDHKVRLWALAAIQKAKGASVAPLATGSGHRDTVRTLAFSPDGNALASGSWDYDIDLWHLTSGPLRDNLVVDDLNDFSKVAYHSPGWEFDTATPIAFNADASRLKRSGDTSENIIYHVDAVKQVEAMVYEQGNGDITPKFTLYASPDNMKWTPVTYTHDDLVPTEVTPTWYRTTLRASLPAGTNYVKIEASHDPSTASPQLSQVRLVTPLGL